MADAASQLSKPVELQTRRDTTRPSLPTELWVKILSYQYPEDHLPYLWIHGRQVSTLFKEAIETMFAKQILPTCDTVFNFGAGPDLDHIYEESETLFMSRSSFSHLSGDHKEIAVFTFESPTCPWHHQDEFKRLLREYWQDVPPAESNHCIRIRRLINDSPMPHCRIEWKKHDKSRSEMTLNWKEMFTYFYGEELIYMREKQKRAMLLDASGTQLRTDMEEALALSLGVQVGKHFREDLSRSIARRRRIQGVCEEQGLDFSDIRYFYPAYELRYQRMLVDSQIYWWEDDFPLDVAKQKELDWGRILPGYQCRQVERHEYQGKK